MVQAGGTNTHVHFDDPVLRPLVPDFEDPRWLGLARRASLALAAIPARIVISVPLGRWSEPPRPDDLRHLTSLDSWEPPALHLLGQGPGAYELRSKRPWYSDDVDEVPGVKGWYAGSLE